MEPQYTTLPLKLIRKYHTRNPFQIAQELGIEVRYIDTKRQKGMCRIIMNTPYIWISQNLSEQMQKMTCAHELGHLLLHKNLLKDQKYVLDMEIFNITDVTEYEANLFAANILIDEDLMIDNLKEGKDIVEVASALNVNVNLLALKLTEMRNIPNELPFTVNPRFMGKIDDRADAL